MHDIQMSSRSHSVGCLALALLFSCNREPSVRDNFSSHVLNMESSPDVRRVSAINCFGSNPDLTSGAHDSIFLAFGEVWSDGIEYQNRVRAMRHIGSEWLEINQDKHSVDCTSGSGSMPPSISTMVLRSGALVRIWDTYGNDAWSVVASFWDGDSWRGLSGVSDCETYIAPGHSPVCMTNRDDDIIIAYISRLNGQRGIGLTKWRWDDVSEAFHIQQQYEALAVGERFMDYGCTIDERENPIIAWTESESHGNSDLHVQRWNGSLWENVENGLDDNDTTARPHLNRRNVRFINDRDGTVYLVWLEGSDGSFKICLAVWSSGLWERLHVASNNSSDGDLLVGSECYEVAMLGDSIILVWSSGRWGSPEMTIAVWDGAYWNKTVIGIQGSGPVMNLSGLDILVTESGDIFVAFTLNDNWQSEVWVADVTALIEGNRP